MSVCVCVCVCERERERESNRAREVKRESVCCVDVRDSRLTAVVERVGGVVARADEAAAHSGASR